jgi:hypothetical protein
VARVHPTAPRTRRSPKSQPTRAVLRGSTTSSTLAATTDAGAARAPSRRGQSPSPARPPASRAIVWGKAAPRAPVSVRPRSSRVLWACHAGRALAPCMAPCWLPSVHRHTARSGLHFTPPCGTMQFSSISSECCDDDALNCCGPVVSGAATKTRANVRTLSNPACDPVFDPHAFPPSLHIPKEH